MKIFKKALSLLLTAAIMVGMMCVSTVSVGAAQNKITVDGFYNVDKQYCVRVDNIPIMEYVDYAVDNYLGKETELVIVLAVFDPKTEKDVYTANGVLRIAKDLNLYNFPLLYEHSTSKNIEIPGRIYNNTEDGGNYGYVFFIEDEKIIKALTDGEIVVAIFFKCEGNIVSTDFSLDYTSVNPNWRDLDSEKNISSLSISKISNKSYTGKAIKPAVTVKDGDKKLVKGTDYTVSYKNNTKIGTASVTIKGKGDYTGEKTLTFKIVPAKTTLKVSKKSDKKAVFSWNAVKGAEKYQLYYSVDGGKTYKKYTTISGSKTSYTATKLNFKKYDYKFKIRAYDKVDKTTYYGSYSKIVSVK